MAQEDLQVSVSMIQAQVVPSNVLVLQSDPLHSFELSQKAFQSPSQILLPLSESEATLSFSFLYLST